MLRLLVAFGVLGFQTLAPQGRADEPRAGKQVAQTTTVTVERDGKPQQVELRYWLFLPQSYDKQQGKLPLLLFLHGAGERGTDLEAVKKHGPPLLVEKQPDFGFIVVSPQCPKDTRWNSAEMVKLVEHVANTYRVDRQRMYVTGLSMGGSGTWSLLAEQPGLFAAGIPICGRGDLASVPQLAKTPIWAVIGGKDKADLVAQNQALVTALEKAGGKIKFTLYPEAGHNSWTETYNNPAVYEWLLEQKNDQ